ncbi:hypothetical protein HY214_03580 [Candidatus Roizmanbacteria bacterium]|nr:hypothetical protein [Candidatus Roizmanbacteria bacterium]
MNKQRNGKHAFTFIEMIVVVGVLLVALPALFSIFFAVVSEQVKVIRLSQVKREGDFALGVMSSVIKGSALAIYSATTAQCTANNFTGPQCSVAGTSYSDSGGAFCFKEKWPAGSGFNFSQTTNSISSASAVFAATPVNLVSDKMYVTNFTLKCTRTATYSPPIVTVSFDICYNTGNSASPCVGYRPQDVASLHYQTSIKMTSY